MSRNTLLYHATGIHLLNGLNKSFFYSIEHDFKHHISA